MTQVPNSRLRRWPSIAACVGTAASSLVVAASAVVVTAVIPVETAAAAPLSYEPELVADVNTERNGSFPRHFVTMGDEVYFRATTRELGAELHAYDPASGDVRLVLDAVDGPGSSSAWPRAVVDGELLFTADDADGTESLYATDGTTDNVRLVKKVAALGFIEVDGVQYFIGTETGSTGNLRELWVTDGTEAGTNRVTDINPTGNASVNDLTPVTDASGDTTIFFAASTSSGSHLFQHDPAGSTAQIDIESGEDWGAPRQLTDFDSHLALTAQKPGGDRTILVIKVSDFNDVALVNEIASTFPQPYLFAAGGRVFVGQNGLGVLDDPSATLTPLQRSTAVVRDFATIKDRLVFSVTEPSNGRELWITDGSVGGTELLTDIAAGPAGSNPSSLVSLDSGHVVFKASDGSGNALWSTGGTPGDAQRLTPAERGSSQLLVEELADDSFVFAWADAETVGKELWRSDPSGPGQEVAVIEPANRGSLPGEFVRSGDSIFWIQFFGDEIVRHDLDTGATTVGPSVDAAEGLLALAGGATFVDTDGDVWTTDGTASGTSVVGSFPRDLDARPVQVGARMFGSSGDVLVTTDGTAAGTRTLGEYDDVRADIHALGELAIISVETIGGTTQILSSDGTSAGTQPVLSDDGGAIRNFSVVDGTGYFTRFGSDEVWRTDGAPGGTLVVSGAPLGARPPIATADGVVYFVPADGTDPAHLVVAPSPDEPGTRVELPADIDDVADQRDPRPVTFESITVLPFATASGGGVLLLDGTTLTRIDMADTPELIVGGDGLAHVVVRDDDTQVWSTDGTVAGTQVRVEFIDAELRAARSFAVIDGDLYFALDTPLLGREPHRLDLTADPEPPVPPVPPVPAGPAIVPLDPARLLETRTGPNDTTIDGLDQGQGRVPADTTIRLQITGRGNVPTGATAAILNITSVKPDQRNFLTVFPCTPQPPQASSLNIAQGGNTANEVIAKLTTTGEICIYTKATTHLLVDVTGYIPATGPDTDPAIVPLDPARLLETRTGPNDTTIDGLDQGQGRVPADTTIRLQITGRGNVPTGATAAILNITSVKPDQRNFLTVFPCTPQPPQASSLNIAQGGNTANEVIAKLTTTGEICIYTKATTHLLVDVTGYIPATGPDTDPAIVPLDPARLLETRTGPNDTTIDGLDQGQGRVPADTTIRLQITGRGNVPTGATAAILNITSVKPDQRNFLTVFPCTPQPPQASSLNIAQGGNTANEVIAKLTTTGEICIYTKATTHLLVDVTGYVPALATA